MLEKSNHTYNRSIPEPNKIVNGQALHRCSKMRFGLRTLATVGSGVFAVYNLLILLNMKPNLAEITRELYIKARTPFGLWGTRPLGLFRYFSSHYIPVNLERDFSAFCEKFTPDYCGIIIYRTGKGAFSIPHAAAIENNRGRIYVYNRFPALGKKYEFSAAEFATDKKNFIVGYFINSADFER